MSLGIVYSRGSVGIKAPLVSVEAHLSRGLPQFTIVGLPETVVKESKDRVRSAILQSGFNFPKKRITVNLAPADLPKEGGRFDLPIAISILIASQQIICPHVDRYELGGELALGGELRAIKGVLPFALSTQDEGKALIIPVENHEEAAWVRSLSIYPLPNLLTVCSQLTGQKDHLAKPLTVLPQEDNVKLCLSEVCGQYHAKKALEIAAAGGHSLLLIGPPGTGKTMLANRLCGILPDLTEAQALEVASIYSISRHPFSRFQLGKRPFRRPHHTASSVALLGGGRHPLPGEVSLAHQGILFLDELPEFSRQVLEVLREPLEAGNVHISRAAGFATYPACCQLIAAMNPCPCGYLTDHKQQCSCSPEQVQRYRNKISGPLLDRIDMQIEVPSLLPQELSSHNPQVQETSAQIKKRVMKARELQIARSGTENAKLSSQEMLKACIIEKEAQNLLLKSLDQFGISARAYHRILKVARTAADLVCSEKIESAHIAQALQFRKFDRNV